MGSRLGRRVVNFANIPIKLLMPTSFSNISEIALKTIPSASKPSRKVSLKIQKMASERKRFSQRLQNRPECKRPYYGPNKKSSRDRSVYKKTTDHDMISKLVTAAYVSQNTNSASSDNQLTEDAKWLSSSTASLNADAKSAYAKVKETMKLYDKYYLQAVKKEAIRCSAKAKKSMGKESGACSEKKKRSIRRPDLKATTKMIQTNAILYRKKQFGHLPGIDVGYQFYSRAAMAALGFHSNPFSGVDFIGKSSKEYKEFKLPLAVAVVLSGCYEDDQDNKEEVIYTGPGGNDNLGNKRQINHQETTSANLALKNNCEESVRFVPVRVVRGHQIDGKKVYTYDGLYKVVEWWKEEGLSGFDVFKYCLRRITGQPPLTTNQVHFINRRALHISSTRKRTVCEDISRGQEKIPIRVINEVDDTPAPTGFKYLMSNQIGENVKLPSSASGCTCIGTCTNYKTCACARLNGSDFPYVMQKGRGRLVEAMDVVYECGPNCGCGPECINRVAQAGIKYQLEIFRTPDKGWAVRTLNLIPSGAPVCEYTGLLRRTKELDTVIANDYIMEIDCLQTMMGMGGRQKRVGNVSASFTNSLKKAKDIDENPEFGIDAGSTGNVSRFINHSCDPNLFVQCMLSERHDPRLAQVFLVASENIPPLQELSYDYNYALNSVRGPNNKIKKLPCHCGAADCRKRLY